MEKWCLNDKEKGEFLCICQSLSETKNCKQNFAKRSYYSNKTSLRHDSGYHHICLQSFLSKYHPYLCDNGFRISGEVGDENCFCQHDIRFSSQPRNLPANDNIFVVMFSCFSLSERTHTNVLQMTCYCAVQFDWMKKKSMNIS